MFLFLLIGAMESDSRFDLEYARSSLVWFDLWMVLIVMVVDIQMLIIGCEEINLKGVKIV